VPLGPYGVAVLTDDADFADVRRDFSAEWREAPDPEVYQALVSVPGNALRNPGFEADQDGDNVPDHWNPNTALSAALTTTEVHEGKAALALTGTAPDMAPLAIHRWVPLTGDRKYRLTAWVKSPSPDAEFRFYVEWPVGDRRTGGYCPWSKGSGEWQELFGRMAGAERGVHDPARPRKNRRLCRGANARGGDGVLRWPEG